MNAAEFFLGGGTNFERPLREAVWLMNKGDFENADIVFIADGEYELSEEYLHFIFDEQGNRKFSVIGVLLGSEGSSSSFSLLPFCKEVYEINHLTEDNLVKKILEHF